MFDWLRRLIGADTITAPARPAAAAEGATPGQATPSAGASLAAAPAYGLRRPLVGRSGTIEGFELQLPGAAQRRLATRTDGVSAAAHQMALLAAAAPLAADGARILVRAPDGLLARGTVRAAVPAGSLLLLDDLNALPGPVAAALRLRGVQLGVPDGPPAAQPVADFVVLQAQAAGLDTVLLSAQRWRERWPRIKVVVLGLAGVGDVEQALRSGAYLAAGSLASRAHEPPPARPLGSAAHRICELLNHLALDRGLDLLAAAVRADVALAWRLLRYANSAAIGLAEPADGVERAVQVLGRSELARWLSVQLLAAADARQASVALQQSALARGRLLENLAGCSQVAEPATVFTLGLLSFCEPLLQMPLADAIAPLRLNAEVNDALLHRRGPLADWLALAEAVEDGDHGATLRLGARLGVEEVIGVQNDAAWAWAARVSANQR